MTIPSDRENEQAAFLLLQERSRELRRRRCVSAFCHTSQFIEHSKLLVFHQALISLNKMFRRFSVSSSIFDVFAMA